MTLRVMHGCSQKFEILRFWNHEAMRDWDAVEEVIMRSLDGSTPPPRPSPARGEGEMRVLPPASRNGEVS